MIKTFSDVREDIVNFMVFQLIWIQNSENNKWRSWLAIQSAVTPTSSFIILTWIVWEDASRTFSCTMDVFQKIRRRDSKMLLITRSIKIAKNIYTARKSRNRICCIISMLEMWMTSLHCCHRVHRKSINKSNFQNEFLALLWWISVVIGIKMKLDCICILKELFNVVYCKQGITVRTINPL